MPLDRQIHSNSLGWEVSDQNFQEQAKKNDENILSVQSSSSRGEEKDENLHEEMADTENLSFSTKLAMEKVFENSLVLKNILKDASTRDLINFRLVKSKWDDLAVKLLIQRKSIELTFDFNIISNNYYSEKLGHEMDELNDCLRKSDRFPCVRFVFKNGDLGSDDVQEFFSLHGQDIRDLSLHQMDCSEGNKFELFWLDLGPNIEVLSLVDLPRFHTKLNFSDLLLPTLEQIKLPRLKRLSTSRCHLEILKGILKSAINLQVYDGFDLGQLDAFMDTNKIDTIKTFTFDVNHGNVENCVKFSNCHPHHLESISFRGVTKSPELYQRVSESVNKVLRASQNCVKKLEIKYPMGFLSGLEFPKLIKVKDLTVSVARADFGKGPIFPTGVDFWKSLPCLEAVILDFFIPEQQYLLKNLFSSPGTADTVKRLQIQGNWSEYWLSKLPYIFPSVKHLDVRKVSDFSRFGKALWITFTRLQSLKLQLNTGCCCPIHRNSYPTIDSTFTGFTEEFCTKLVETDPENISLEDIEKCRQNPSILNLKDLRDLSINIVNSWDYPNPRRFLSRATGIFAFKLMPQLKVKICIRAKARSFPVALNDIAPFVTAVVNFSEI